MLKSGKIGYTLTYNAFFLLIIPLVHVFAGIAGGDDVLFLLVAAAMMALGVVLIKRQAPPTTNAWRVVRLDPFVLTRDRLARNLLAGAMIWFNIYFLITANGNPNPRAKPDAWAFYNIIAFAVLALAWLLILTSPADEPRTRPGETGRTA